MKRAQQLAAATVVMTLILIAVGVYVRASGSGLGCPDWPTCHGGVIPPAQKHSLIEVSHRIVASLVGFMVIGNAILAWKHYRHVPFIVWLAALTVPLVGFQGILGAITVVRELPAEVVATHLLTAMLVLSAEIVLTVAMYREDPARRDRFVRPATQVARTGRWALLALVWLSAVLWVGGYMSESGAAAACDAWPGCTGASLIPAADEHEITHMLHRYLAGAFILLLIPVMRAARALSPSPSPPSAEGRGEGGRTPSPSPAAAGGGSQARLGRALPMLWAAQVTVGAFNVWFTFPDLLTVSHTVIASLIWGTLTGMAALAFYVPQPAAIPRPVRASGETP